MASAEREPNEGLGAVPPAESVGKAPGQEVRGGASLKLNTFFVFSYPEKAQSCYDMSCFMVSAFICVTRQQSFIFLARSANLPIGLCILPSVISSFFLL